MKTIQMSDEAVSDLRTAFMFNQYDTECYLDTGEGRVIWFSGDTPVDGEPGPDAPDWVREAYEKRMTIWNDDEGRFLELPPSDVTQACEDMAEYLDEQDGRLARKFESSGKHRAVFESFERAVERDPEHRKKWRAFRQKRVQERVEEWLELQGYELEVE